ncbi:MAG: protein translocase subunit SecF [Alphaproteobacteria bacterium]|nr:protein translocase subunit SecF [Alphaproteobacteria bacterium]
MKLFSWITKETNYDFVGKRKAFYILSAIMIFASIASIAIKGFNYGIDFSGGVLIEIKGEEVFDLNVLRDKLSQTQLEDVTLQAIGETGTELMIRAQAEGLNEKELLLAVNQVKEVIGEDVEYRKVEQVGPQVGDELKVKGAVAAIIAILALSAYVWIRFEWQFAIGTMLGLAQDGLVAAGLLSFFDMDFSLTTLASLLTLIGYSINDKVVTYDRIRENLKKHKKMLQLELINTSINEMLARTLLTGISTLGASIALLIWGGEALHVFSFVITFCVIIGTYSSIFTSAMILNVFDLRKVDEDRVNPFEKIG